MKIKENTGLTHGARQRVHLLPVRAHVRGWWEVWHQPGRLTQPSSSQQQVGRRGAGGSGQLSSNKSCGKRFRASLVGLHVMSCDHAWHNAYGTYITYIYLHSAYGAYIAYIYLHSAYGAYIAYIYLW